MVPVEVVQAVQAAQAEQADPTTQAARAEDLTRKIAFEDARRKRLVTSVATLTLAAYALVVATSFSVHELQAHHAQSPPATATSQIQQITGSFTTSGIPLRSATDCAATKPTTTKLISADSTVRFGLQKGCQRQTPTRHR